MILVLSRAETIHRAVRVNRSGLRSVGEKVQALQTAQVQLRLRMETLPQPSRIVVPFLLIAAVIGARAIEAAGSAHSCTVQDVGGLASTVVVHAFSIERYCDLWPQHCANARNHTRHAAHSRTAPPNAAVSGGGCELELTTHRQNDAAGSILIFSLANRL